MYPCIHVYVLIMFWSQLLPFLLKDWVKKEVATINETLKANEANQPKVQDPTNSIMLVCNVFLDWYNFSREPLRCSTDLRKVAKKTKNFQLALKTMFPKKSGKSYSVYCTCFVQVIS